MVLSSLDTDFGNIEIVNKELSVLNNLVDDFAAGAQYLAGSELALRALMRQLEMVTINTALQSTLVCYIISEMLEHGHARFPTSIASTLLENASVKIVGSSPVDIYSTTEGRASTGFQEEGKEATLLLIKFVELDTRFEEYFASNRDHLVQFIQLGIAFSLPIQTADDFPQIARRIVAAMGSVSSHPRFQTIVDISLRDPVFGLFVHQMMEPPPTPRVSILFQESAALCWKPRHVERAGSQVTAGVSGRAGVGDEVLVCRDGSVRPSGRPFDKEPDGRKLRRMQGGC